jgi:hypothetical protein
MTPDRREQRPVDPAQHFCEKLAAAAEDRRGIRVLQDRATPWPDPTHTPGRLSRPRGGLGRRRVSGRW